MTYPKWVSRGADIGEILCLNAEEEAAVNAERDERENGDAETSASTAEAVESIHTLRAKLDASGIAYDKRFGVERLKSMLPQE